MHLARRSWFALALLGALALVPSAAHAGDLIIRDSGKHERPATLDFTGGLWVLGDTSWFGGAAWLCLPIVPQGFIPPLNDTFNLEFGLWSFYYHPTRSNNYFGLTPAAGVRWDFHLAQQWTVFGSGKLGFFVPFGSDAPRSHLEPAFTVGALYKYSSKTFVRLETGNLGLFQAGVSLVL